MVINDNSLADTHTHTLTWNRKVFLDDLSDVFDGVGRQRRRRLDAGVHAVLNKSDIFFLPCLQSVVFLVSPLKRARRPIICLHLTLCILLTPSDSMSPVVFSVNHINLGPFALGCLIPSLSLESKSWASSVGLIQCCQREACLNLQLCLMFFLPNPKTRCLLCSRQSSLIAHQAFPIGLHTPPPPAPPPGKQKKSKP